MVWTIEYAESVRKPIAKLDPQTRNKIRAFLDERIARLEDPRSQGKALTGPPAASGAMASEISASSAT